MDDEPKAVTVGRLRQDWNGQWYLIPVSEVKGFDNLYEAFISVEDFDFKKMEKIRDQLEYQFFEYRIDSITDLSVAME